MWECVIGSFSYVVLIPVLDFLSSPQDFVMVHSLRRVTSYENLLLGNHCSNIKYAKSN